MPKPKKWDPNRSPVGWYIATYLERFEFQGEVLSNPKRLCQAWKNSILIKAKTPELAYQRALKLIGGKEDDPWRDKNGRPGRLIFDGFTGLIPVYEELEHGAEILWTDYPNITVGRVKKMVRPKEKLEVFTPNP